MNEPKLASIFRLMRRSECIAAIPPQKPKKKKSASRQIQSCWAPKKLSNIRNTYFHFSFIVFQELNRISQISTENDFIIIIFC